MNTLFTFIRTSKFGPRLGLFLIFYCYQLQAYCFERCLIKFFLSKIKCVLRTQQTTPLATQWYGSSPLQTIYCQNYFSILNHFRNFSLEKYSNKHKNSNKFQRPLKLQFFFHSPPPTPKYHNSFNPPKIPPAKILMFENLRGG